jgi:hypothetical protein
MDHAGAVSEWLARNRDEVDRVVQEAIDSLEQDTPLRVPRSEADRRNDFALWLSRYHERLVPRITDEIQQRLSARVSTPVPAEVLQKVVDDQVWPEVERFLRWYAIRGQAAGWVTRHMGDATTIGAPEPHPAGWRVPLGVAGYGDDLGQVVLDRDGNIVASLTSTANELREAMGGCARSAPATAARQ